MREEVVTKALKLRTWAEGLERYQFNNSTVILYRKPLWSRFFSVLSHLRSLTLNYKTKRASVNVLMNYFFSRISLLSYKVLINSRKEWPFSCTLKDPHFYVLFWARERLMQIKRFSEQKDKYNKVLKMSAAIPATGKNSCVIIGYFHW